MDEAPSSSAPVPEPGKEETASARQKSGDLPMKVVTGGKDADASDSTAFDDADLDMSFKPATAAASGVEAPSPGTPPPAPPETESAPEHRSGQPEPGSKVVALRDNIVKGKVVLTEKPDWSFVAKVFESFIPECKTIADIDGTEVRYRALSRRGRRAR